LRKYVFILFASIVLNVFPQSTNKFSQISPPEKRWDFFPPFIAKKCYKLTVKAREVSKIVAKESVLDKDENGGQVDAFRHSYWMALLAQKIKPKKAFKLGKAHEKGNYWAFKKGEYEDGAQPDSLASVMDIYNNAVGIEIGKSNKKLTEEELKLFVIKSVLSGDMRMFKKDNDKNYLDCIGNKIDLSFYKGKWSIPKCLISTVK